MNGTPEPPSELDRAQAEKDLAEAEKTRAEAAKLRAEARQLEAEAEQLDAETAAGLTARLHRSETEKKIAEAEKDAAAARLETAKRYVPDFVDIERGSLDVDEKRGVLASALAARATRAAAGGVAKAVKNAGVGDNYGVLVTTDADLAGSDAVASEVDSALTLLTGLADQALATHRAAAPAQDVQTRGAGVGPLDLAAAVIAAVPAVVGLFSARRTLSHAETTLDDETAAIAVAGALAAADSGATVLHDDMRRYPAGALTERVRQLRGKRVELASALGTARARAKQAPDDTAAAASEHLLAAVVERMDAGLDALTETPQRGRRSALAAAELRTILRDATSKVRHVLLVRGEAGSVHQSMDDKPLFFQDKFAAVAASAITFLLVDLRDDRVRAGGTVPGTAALRGSLGSTITIENIA